MEKSPFRGPAQAKVTIVEFSNFQLPLLREVMGEDEGTAGKVSSGHQIRIQQFPCGERHLTCLNWLRHPGGK